MTTFNDHYAAWRREWWFNIATDNQRIRMLDIDWTRALEEDAMKDFDDRR